MSLLSSTRVHSRSELKPSSRSQRWRLVPRSRHALRQIHADYRILDALFMKSHSQRGSLDQFHLKLRKA